MIIELYNQVLPLSFSFFVKLITWSFFLSEAFLEQRMGPQGIPESTSKKWNAVWWAVFFFFKVIYFKTLTSGILKLIFVCWILLTISQSHSLLSCFSCCVPTTPDPISNSWDSLRLTKVLLWFQLLFCKRKWVLGLFLWHSCDKVVVVLSLS